MSAATSEALASAEWTNAAGVVALLDGAVPEKTIANLARDGRIPSLKVGTRRVFHVPTVRAELLKAMQAGRGL